MSYLRHCGGRLLGHDTMRPVKTVTGIYQKACRRLLPPSVHRLAGVPRREVKRRVRAPTQIGIDGVQIRRASPLDVGTIMSMALSYHKEGSERRAIMSDPRSAFLYRVIGPIYIWQRFLTLKAIQSGRIVGYIMLLPRGNVLEVWELGVSPEFRKRGIGTALMKIAQDLARTRFECLSLIVSEGNSGALGLYGKLGFLDAKITPIRYTIHRNGKVKRRAARSRKRSIAVEPITGEVFAQDYARVASEVARDTLGGAVRLPREVLIEEHLVKGIDYLRASISGRRSAYASLGKSKDAVSITLLVEPESCNARVMTAVLRSFLNHLQSEESLGAELEVRVLQAQEACLKRALVSIGATFERSAPMLRLFRPSANPARLGIDIPRATRLPQHDGIGISGSD
jgi:ribosomal protein S18 acetylase RimI-like enzyme